MYEALQAEIDQLKPYLNQTKKKMFWGQFISVSKNWHIDTSVSCMIFYSLSLIKETDEYKSFYNFINKYYGKSEQSQGVLLSIFKNELKG